MYAIARYDRIEGTEMLIRDDGYYWLGRHWYPMTPEHKERLHVVVMSRDWKMIHGLYKKMIREAKGA